MTFLLSSENVLNYLIDHLLVQPQDGLLASITLKEYRNFNLVISLPKGDSLLVKQERFHADKGSQCEFWREQRICELFQHFSELRPLLMLTSEVVYFDPNNFIIVLRYFANFVNLSHFYAEQQAFPAAISKALGRALALVHRNTWGQSAYQSFLTQGKLSDYGINRVPSFLRGLERIGPGIFSKVSTEGLDFWRLYQRYESLHQSVVDISDSYECRCLIHNDLEFRNILVEVKVGETGSINARSPEVRIKLIDWEFFRWGDPAYDLAIVLSSYLDLWLESLVVSPTIPIQTSLVLAAIPLERLQSSMTALVQSYITEFPTILEHQPNFLKRVMQFTGLVLIKKIQGNLEHLQPFDNTSICTLQVAKMLLCSPEKSIIELFGTSAADLTHPEGAVLC